MSCLEYFSGSPQDKLQTFKYKVSYDTQKIHIVCQEFLRLLQKLHSLETTNLR